MSASDGSDKSPLALLRTWLPNNFARDPTSRSSSATFADACECVSSAVTGLRNTVPPLCSAFKSSSSEELSYNSLCFSFWLAFKREPYDKKLENALTIRDLEWSKGNNFKTQCSRLNTSPLHRRNASNKNGPARVKWRMQWEAPSKPLAVDDSLLLPEQEVHAEICLN